jgi:epoxide hydrolase
VVYPNDITLRPLTGGDPNVVCWAEFTGGGRFAALEVSGLLAGGIRQFFR